MANFVPRDGTTSNLGRSDKAWGTLYANAWGGTAAAAARAGTSTTAENLSGTAPYALVAGTVYGMGTGTSSGTGDYATLAGTAINFSGTATASLTAGTAQAALTFSGTAPAASQAGTAQWALLAGTAEAFSGTALAALTSGTAQTALTFSGTAPYSLQAGTALYALSGGTGGPAVGGTADFAAIAGTALQFFGTAPYATSAGTALVFAGTATAALTAGTAQAALTFSGTAAYASNSALLNGTNPALFVSRKVTDDTKEPTGFLNRTDSTIAFNSGSRLFTISGAHSIYSHGTLFACSDGTLTINATPGVNFVFYGTTGALSQVQGFPGFDQALAASIYYNGTKGLLADERHGIIMDSATHEYLHDTVRCRYEIGLAGTFADASFTLSAGTIADEDLEFGMPEQGTCQVLYRRAGVWDWTTQQGSYYYASGGNVYYDNAGTIAAATSNRFVAYWIFATTDVGCPIVSLMGQREDTTLANARANNTPDALSLTSLPYNEMKLLYRVILKNDATPYEEVADYRNVSSLPVSSYVATDHLTLSNIGKYKHTEIDAFIDGSQVGTAQFAAIAGTALNFFGTATAALTAGTAQTALTFSGTAPYALGAGSWWGWNGTASAFSGTAPAAVRAGTASSAENFSGTAIAATNAGTSQVAQFVSYASTVIYAGSAITLPASNLTASGIITSQIVGEAVGFGNTLFMGSDGAYYKSDADAASTMPISAMALGTYGSGASCKMLHYGWVWNDAWNFTKGALVYADTAAGSLGTAPTGSGDQVQVAAIAYGTGKLFFCPSPVLVELT